MESWSILDRIVRGVVRRRKRLALITGLVALVILLPVAYLISKEPPRYRTSAVVLLEARPDRVPVFQDLTPVRPFPVQLAILNSRSLAETVAENLPNASLQELLETSYQVDFLQTLNNAYLRWRGIEAPAPNPTRAALAELQRARVTFMVWPDKTGIVTISAEASRPQVSVDIVNTYIEALMARTRTFNVDDARVSREFLEQQVTDVKRTMNASEQTLQAFVASRGGIRLPDQSRAAADRLALTETSLAEVTTSQKMLQARLDALRDKVDGQKRSDPKVAAAVRMSSPEVERLRAQLTQLESSLLDLRTKYTEEHPRIRVVKARIDEIMHSLGGALKDSVVTTAAPGAVPPAERVNFAEQLIALEATYHYTAAREEALRKQAETLRQSLKGLSGGEAEYARLSRDVDSQRSLHALLSDKLTAARIREQGEMKVVKVIDPASFPVQVPNPKRMLVLTVALGASLCLGAGVPAAVEWFHRKIENEDDVQAATGLPVLAVVPRVRVGPAVFNGSVAENRLGPSEQLMFTEAFRTLRVGIELGTRGEPLRSLLVTSSFADEGKSTVVVNLGFALSESGRRVVVADTDFLRPTLHRVMKIKSAKGLVEALETPGQPVEPALAPVSEGLWLAQRGESVQPSSRGMLGGTKLRELIGDMATRADFVICDSSPVLLVPDNLLLAGSVDGVVLVARASSTGFRDLARAKEVLEGAGARVLGVVLNQVPAASLKNYYRRYYESYVKKVRKK
jgi:succinoglycan biosynthesis transport protein ExoP